MNEKLKRLQDNQETILLSEIGALIHDLGKLNNIFIERHSIEGDKDPILSQYKHGDILEYDLGEHNSFYPDNEELKQKAEKLRSLLENIKVKYNGESSKLYLFIKSHHCKNEGEKCPNDFVRLLKVSDSFDSEEDRSHASDRQSICKTYYSNAFGYEKEINTDYKAERSAVYDYIINLLDTYDISKIKTKRKEFLYNLKNSFSKALGMTARAANDVTLWEHSYMTASIMKTLLCQSILKNNFPIVKNKEKIEGTFRILSIGWDFFDFVEQSHTIPDVVGRIKVLEEVKEELKALIETEFLLGNCIYEDDYGVHFLVPAIFDDLGIIKEKIFKIFNEKTNGVLISHLNLTKEDGRLTDLLPKAIEELEKRIKEREIDFVPKWIDYWENSLVRNKLICNVCGKGFYYEGEKEEICRTCKDIRNKGREERSQQTVFIDEIAWSGIDYENVALLVLNFELKNWLNGKFVRSLFIRKYDDRDAEFLFGYYKNEKEMEETIESFEEQGALVGWIKSRAEDAKESAKKNLEKCVQRYKDLSSFSKNTLKPIISIIDQILETLDDTDTARAEKLLETLNSNIQNVKKSKKIVEDKLLNPYPRQRKEEIRIIKESDSLNEVKEKIFLKTSSPSRLMRVWNNTKGFFEDLSAYICEESLIIERYVLAIDRSLNVDGKAWKIEISAEGKSKKERGEVVFDGKNCITVTPHINKFIDENIDAQLKVKVIDRDWMEAGNDEFLVKSKKKRYVKGYRTLSVSPNMFTFLIPASKVFDIVL